MKLYFDEIPSPLGKLTIIASDKALHALLWGNVTRDSIPLPSEPILRPTHPMLRKTRKQLAEYFAGRRTKFDLPLEPFGTEFQKKAWSLLRKIPYGKTLSYQEQAAKLGDARKARAVGAANGRNPLSIIVPCHRVVSKSGKLAGFAGGLAAKEYLLKHEQASHA